MSDEKIQMKGIVQSSSKGTFVVKLDNGHTVICQLAGKMKMYKIRVLPGDSVTVEMSPYDLTRGRIVQREKIK